MIQASTSSASQVRVSMRYSAGVKGVEIDKIQDIILKGVEIEALIGNDFNFVAAVATQVEFRRATQLSVTIGDKRYYGVGIRYALRENTPLLDSRYSQSTLTPLLDILAPQLGRRQRIGAIAWNLLLRVGDSEQAAGKSIVWLNNTEKSMWKVFPVPLGSLDLRTV